MKIIEKTKILFILILVLIALNLFFYKQNPILPKELFTTKEMKLIEQNGLEFKVPLNFPPPEWQGNEEEGRVSFNQLLENSRYTQYFVIVWSKNNLNWETLLPNPRVSPGGKIEEYRFGKVQKKPILIGGYPSEYRVIDFVIIRTCGTEHKNFLLAAEFTSPKTNKHFICLTFSQKNKEKEFSIILNSLKID